MPSGSVEILIDADDRASAKLAQVQANVAKSVQHMRVVGERAKKSTEFVGSLANAMGGTAFGHYAQGLAQLTERVSHFAEVSKAGAAGALAFRVGLGAMAGVIGFQVGKAIGNVIFQTERWKEEMDAAKTEAKEMTSELLKLEAVRFGRQQEDIDTTFDDAKKRKEQINLLRQLKKEEEGYVAWKKYADEFLAKRAADPFKITSFGSKEARAKEVREQLAGDKERLKIVQERIKAIEYELSEEKAARDARKQAFEDEKQHAIELKQLREEEMRDAEKYRKQQENDLKEIAQEKEEMRKADKAAASAIADEVNPQRIRDRKAADIRRLMQSGDLDRQTGLAALGLNEGLGASNRATQAFQGRLLTRGGPGFDPAVKAAKETNTTLKSMDQTLKQMLQYDHRSQTFRMEVIGNR